MNTQIGNMSWVRIALVLIGIAAIVLAFDHLGPAVTLLAKLPWGDWPAEGLVQGVVVVVITPLPLLLIGYVLIRYCHHFAKRICNVSSHGVPYWEQAAYRLAATFAGVLVLSWALPRFAAVLTNMATANKAGLPPEWSAAARQGAWVSAIYGLLQTSFGLYLLWGAPHLVKWQIRRSHGDRTADNTGPPPAPASPDQVG